MATELDPTVVADVANTNFKVVAGTPALALARQNAMMGDDAISHQRVINGIREAMFGALVKGIAKVDIETAVAEAKITSSDLASKVLELGTAVNSNTAQIAEILAAIQQLAKIANTTPPESGK